MSALPWFRCNPRRFRDGMVGMSREERGTYATLIMLMYERAGPIPDDPVWIAGHLGCSQKLWLKDRASLIVRGKIRETILADGRAGLFDDATEEELSDQMALRKKFSTGGKRPRNQTHEIQENNDLGSAPLEPPCSPAGEIESKNKIPPSVSPSGDTSPQGEIAQTKATKPRKANTPKSRRCPETWEPSDKHEVLARSLGMTPEQGAVELAKFRDYEFSRPYSDWDATFNNWLRNAASRLPRTANVRSIPSPAPGLQRHLDREQRRDAGLVEAVNRRVERWGLNG